LFVSPILFLFRTPTLCVTGVDGMPALGDAGNVLRSHTTVKLSVRLPPTVKPAEVGKEWEELLTKNVPYDAKVTFNVEKAQGGWCAPTLAPWLENVLHQASQTYYKKDVRFWGEGGSIPFMVNKATNQISHSLHIYERSNEFIFNFFFVFFRFYTDLLLFV
jgi:acetylornithine deacetylase/succinyl-diaminopimelate desuccinylase-like protein